MFIKKDTAIDYSQRLFQNIYDWSKEELEKFYNDNVENVMKNENLMTGADVNNWGEIYKYLLLKEMEE